MWEKKQSRKLFVGMKPAVVKALLMYWIISKRTILLYFFEAHVDQIEKLKIKIKVLRKKYPWSHNLSYLARINEL